MRRAGIENFNPPAADDPVLAELLRRLVVSTQTAITILP